jgi:hypothetical protein
MSITVYSEFGPSIYSMSSACIQDILVAFFVYSIENATSAWRLGIEQDSCLVNALTLRVLPEELD